MARPKITLAEPDGPLRTGLMDISRALGDIAGGVFQMAHGLATAGVDLVSSFDLIALGDSDKSIPPSYNAVKILRERGEFSQETDSDRQPEQYLPRM